MTPTWTGQDLPPPMQTSFGVMGWVRIFLRGLSMILVVFGGLLVLLLIRLIERPLCGVHRPVTPHVTTFVCRTALRILGLRLVVRGTPMRDPGATVANHGSWLDIFVLNATRQLYFVSKAEVEKWPGIGWLARATGTVFISRDRRAARVQTDLFRERLLAGHQLLFFPEGTSTDAIRVLPFKTTLFAAFFDYSLRHDMNIQSATVVYHAPEGADRRFYGWWGDMEFGSHLLSMLAVPRHGLAEVVFHDPLRVDDFPDRKALASFAEAQVRDTHQRLLPPHDSDDAAT